MRGIYLGHPPYCRSCGGEEKTKLAVLISPFPFHRLSCSGWGWGIKKVLLIHFGRNDKKLPYTPVYTYSLSQKIIYSCIFVFIRVFIKSSRLPAHFFYLSYLENYGYYHNDQYDNVIVSFVFS